MMARMVDDEAIGIGERVEQDKRRGYKRTLRWAAASGAVTGATFMLAIGGFRGLADPKMSPPIAIVLTILYVVTIAVCSVIASRQSDEHEQSLSLWAYAYAGGTYLAVYPPWYLLWKGGLVREPQHGALFLLFFAVAMIAYAIKKFR